MKLWLVDIYVLLAEQGFLNREELNMKHLTK